eukprot:scaffold80418_cov36-Cyclotella_meneghiniana.AAC.2
MGLYLVRERWVWIRSWGGSWSSCSVLMHDDVNLYLLSVHDVDDAHWGVVDREHPMRVLPCRISIIMMVKTVEMILLVGKRLGDKKLILSLC